MKFDEKYPGVTNPQKLFPDKLLGPHREIEVSPELTQSWRVYSCVVCRAPTGWRYTGDGSTAPCCSEECMATMKQNDTEAEAAPRPVGDPAKPPPAARACA